MNSHTQHSTSQKGAAFALSALLLASLCATSVNSFAANSKVDSLPLSAERIGLQLQHYQTLGAGPFTAEAGQQLWQQEVDNRSCTSCHTADVTSQGTHQKTRKAIDPMSPSITNQRLTDAANIEKWFARNCNWTFKRDCTAQEKGDTLLWLSQQ